MYLVVLSNCTIKGQDDRNVYFFFFLCKLGQCLSCPGVIKWDILVSLARWCDNIIVGFMMADFPVDMMYTYGKI